MIDLYDWKEKTKRFPIQPEGSVGRYIQISEELEFYVKDALQGLSNLAEARKGIREVKQSDLYFALRPNAETHTTSIEGKHEFASLWIEIGNYGSQPVILNPEGRVSHMGGGELSHFVQIKFPNFSHYSTKVVWESKIDWYINEDGYETPNYDIKIYLKHYKA